MNIIVKYFLSLQQRYNDRIIMMLHDIYKKQSSFFLLEVLADENKEILLIISQIIALASYKQA